MQEFDIDEETDFLLGGAVNHGSDMDTYYTTGNRNRRSGGRMKGPFCR